jgi:hypothetical protein
MAQWHLFDFYILNRRSKIWLVDRTLPAPRSFVRADVDPCFKKRDLSGWYTCCRRVFAKLGFELHADVIHGLAQCKPWYIENVLILLRERIEDQVYSAGTTWTGTGTGTGPALTSRTNVNTSRYNKQPFHAIVRCWDSFVHTTVILGDWVSLWKARATNVGTKSELTSLKRLLRGLFVNYLLFAYCWYAHTVKEGASRVTAIYLLVNKVKCTAALPTAEQNATKDTIVSNGTIHTEYL